MIQPIGFIKLHRELASKPIWLKSTAEQKVILLTLLMMANFNNNQWEWKGEKFEVKPGQFITSLDSIVKECGKGISIQNVRTALTRFEKLEFLTNKPTSEGRLITIENWAFYQGDNKPSNIPSNKRLTKGSQSTNKALTPIEEGNNDNNENNDKKNIKNYVPDVFLNQAIIDFVEFRKSIKKPMTDKAVLLLLGNLNKLSADLNEQIEILNQSIVNGWQGVFALKNDFNTNKSIPEQITSKMNSDVVQRFLERGEK
jgi:hypothetical protein